MKRIFFTLFAIILVSEGHAVPLKLQVFAEDRALAGAHIYHNNSIRTVSNENGVATIQNAHPGDTVAVSFIGYSYSEKVISEEMLQHREVQRFDLIPIDYDLSEVVVTAHDDMNIFKQKLRSGLRLSTNAEKRLFEGVDTISNLEIETSFSVVYSGEVVGWSGRFNPIFYRFDIKFEHAADKDSEAYYYSKGDGYKEVIEGKTRNKFSNSLCYVQWLLKFNSAVKIFYRGSHNGFDLFYFYVPDGIKIQGRDSTKDCHINGMVYINTTDGILERIDANYASYTFGHSSYVDTYYFAAEGRNRIWVKEIANKTYGLDEQMNIIGTVHSRIRVGFE